MQYFEGRYYYGALGTRKKCSESKADGWVVQQRVHLISWVHYTSFGRNEKSFQNTQSNVQMLNMKSPRQHFRSITS